MYVYRQVEQVNEQIRVCLCGPIVLCHLSRFLFQVHQLGDKLMFFVNDTRAANQLKQLGQIQSRDGPLTVMVKPSPPPKGGGPGGKQEGGTRFESAPRFRVKGVRDGDEVMEEDPTEVVKVRLYLCLCEYMHGMWRAFNWESLNEPHIDKFQVSCLDMSSASAGGTFCMLGMKGKRCAAKHDNFGKTTSFQ